MPRVRALHDAATGKTWSTLLDGSRTELRQGTLGRERVVVRQHDDAEAAYRWTSKEEWTRLKKGMVLLAPAALWGEPRLHRFIGGAYTGAMAIAADGDGGFFCNRFLDADEVIRVGPDAEVAACISLPRERLVWKVAKAPATGPVLLQVDGGIERWRPEAGMTEAVVAYRPNPGFLSVAGTRIAYYDGADAVVAELNRGEELLRVPARAEMYNGHSPQMEGALSADGQLLALCTRPGEIILLDVTSGQPRPSLRGDFAMVRQMDFLPDCRRLLVTEGYGSWSLRCLDIETGQPHPEWTEMKNDGGALAVSPSGRRVAVAGRRTIAIHGFGTDSASRSFPLEHAVKRCAMAWIAEDALAVRTDYGCASIYAVP
jgi:hypothetical protein